MLSKDRYGNDIQPRYVANPSNYKWSVRLVDNKGRYNSTSLWDYYEIPSSAIISRSRSAKLDGKTWQCQLSLLRDALPDAIRAILLGSGIEYYTLEIDIIDADGTAFPYHTGPVDSVQQATGYENGSPVSILDVASFGILQRTKKVYTTNFCFLPETDAYIANNGMIMLAEAVTVVGPTAVIGTPSIISQGYNTINATVGSNPALHSDPIQVTTDNTWATINKVYGVDYTITDAAGTGDPTLNQPIYIKWITAVPATYYVKFWQVRYAGFTKHSAITTLAFRVPDGRTTSAPKRTIYDDFLTRIASVTSASVFVPEDAESYKSTNYLVAVTGFAPDFLEWQKPDGSTEVRQISSTNSSGQITLSTGFSATPAVGDYIRVVTCETIRAWDRFNVESLAYFTTPALSYFYRFNLDGTGAAKYPRQTFKAIPELGVITPNQPRHFDTTTGDLLYNDVPIFTLPDTANSGLTGIGSDNRIESALYQFIVTQYPLMESSKFVVGNKLGAYAKNINKVHSTLDAVLNEIAEDGMPPNGYFHDRPDGGFVVSAFRQESTPVAQLSNIISVSTTERPEFPTQVTIVSKTDEPAICTHMFEITRLGFNNSNRVFDGQTQDLTLYADSVGGYFAFKYPRKYLPFLDDFISSVKIYGISGVVSASVSYFLTGSSCIVPGFGAYRQINQSEPLEIPGEEIAKAINRLVGQEGNGYELYNYPIYLFIVFFPDETATPASDAKVTEIEIYSNYVDSWTASLTDDDTTVFQPTTSGSLPTNWKSVSSSTGAGPNWWQRMLGYPMSFKYMPSDPFRRLVTSIDNLFRFQFVKHRTERIELTRVSQAECRQIAERYLDEYLKLRVGYTVRGALHPQLEPGDTIAVNLPDGTTKNLFIWGINDSGAGDEFEADYELVDYSA